MLYNPPHFQVQDRATLEAQIEANGFATLVSSSSDGPVISHLPLILDRENNRLIGHVARGNPHWKLASTLPSTAIFMGPDAYISPNWYPSKAETHKVVPTWNYRVIHVRGTLVFHDTPAFTRDAVERLTRHHEAGRAAPWTVSDAPESYIAAMLRGIVGFELAIVEIEGKHKLSQNRTAEDRAGVIAGLDHEKTAGSAAIRAEMLTNEA